MHSGFSGTVLVYVCFAILLVALLALRCVTVWPRSFPLYRKHQDDILSEHPST